MFKLSSLEKAKARLRTLPRDYSYNEARQLLAKLGFEERTQGKTSGSRVGFYRERDDSVILLHKPHPKNIMSAGAVRALAQFLTDKGDL